MQDWLCLTISATIVGLSTFTIGWLLGVRKGRRTEDEFPIDESFWPSETEIQSRAGADDADQPGNEEDNGDDVKLVLLVRTDLQMTKGKACAQCSHATVKACQTAYRYAPKKLYAWLCNGQKKITLKVTGEDLPRLLETAKQRGIICGKVVDAGHTQVEPNTVTVGFLGPWDEGDIDAVSGTLKLY